MVLEGLQDLKEEIKLWKEEVKEKLDSDPVVVFRPNEIDPVFRFKGK
jgi:NADH dehydrogenase [ubiquinone] 1 alpha subcomplex assembly factor 1